LIATAIVALRGRCRPCKREPMRPSGPKIDLLISQRADDLRKQSDLRRDSDWPGAIQLARGEFDPANGRQCLSRSSKRPLLPGIQQARESASGETRSALFSTVRTLDSLVRFAPVWLEHDTSATEGRHRGKKCLWISRAGGDQGPSIDEVLSL
jgi:hypothetical protein